MASEHPADCEAQLLIEKEKAQLLESIRQLNQERNHFSLVSKLPPEMLGNVFVHAAPGDGYTKPATRFNFSFVSRHWRNVALSTPQIWSFLPEANLNWCRVMLERSKTTDLVIQFTNLGRWGREETISRKLEFLREILGEHATHITRLKIESFQNFSIPLPPTSPRLQHLSLTFSNWHPKPHLSAQTFSNSPLVELILEHCSVDWQSFAFPGLKTLNLKNVTSSDSATLPDFVEALRKMPRLEIVDISTSIPTFDEEHLPTGPAVLLSLQKLRIHGSMIDITNFIRWLNISTSATLIFDTTLHITHYTPFGRSLAIFFSGMVGPGIHGAPSYDTLLLSSFQDTSTFQAWLNPHVYQGFTQTRSDNPQFTLYMASFDYSLSRVTAGLPLEGLKTLSIQSHHEEEVPASFLTESFGNLPNLETIMISRPSSNELFHALQDNLDSNTEDQNTSQLSFPQLKNLSLKNIVFRKESKPDVVSISLDSFKDCIRSRRERGAPIEKLSIYDSYYLFKKNIPPLERMVDKLEWDGNQLRLPNN